MSAAKRIAGLAPALALRSEPTFMRPDYLPAVGAVLQVWWGRRFRHSHTLCSLVSAFDPLRTLARLLKSQKFQSLEPLQRHLVLQLATEEKNDGSQIDDGRFDGDYACAFGVQYCARGGPRRHICRELYPGHDKSGRVLTQRSASRTKRRAFEGGPD
jgi:hypothetical protein